MFADDVGLDCKGVPGDRGGGGRGGRNGHGGSRNEGSVRACSIRRTGDGEGEDNMNECVPNVSHCRGYMKKREKVLVLVLVINNVERSELIGRPKPPD